MKKKLISYLLSVALCASTIAVPVTASEDAIVIADVVEEEIVEYKSDDLEVGETVRKLTV